MAKDTSKIFSSDLEILTVFAKSLKVSFILHLFHILFCMFWSQSRIRKQGSWHLSESLILPFITPVAVTLFVVYMAEGMFTVTYILACIYNV